VVTFLERSASRPCMSLEALDPAGAPDNLSGERISPAGQAGLLAAAAASAAPNSPASQVLRSAPAARTLAVSGASYAVSQREPSQGRPCEIFKGDNIMAITLGTFTKLDDGVFTGTLKTLNVTAALTIVPVDKMSENAPDHRVYAGQRYEVGAGWSQVAKSSGETYVNLKIGAPEFGPSWVRCRLVKLEHANNDGATHIALWEPRDR
jgi:uncharacterized protein (DUF736 family)